MVVGHDLERGVEAAGVFHRPGYAHLALGFGVQGVDAVRLVDGHAAAAGDVAHNVVARHGIAAAGKAYQHAGAAFHINALRGLALMAYLLRGGQRRLLGLFQLFSLALLFNQTGNDVGGGDHAAADSALQILHIVESVFFKQRGNQIGLGQLAQLHAAAFGLVLEHVAALLYIFAAQLALEILADLGARALRFDDLKPVQAGAFGIGAGHDLYAVACLQLGVQRHDTAVDLGACAGIAHSGVHTIGKVQGRSAARQVDNIALGGENEHLLAEQIGLQTVDKFMAVTGFALPVEDLTQPVELLIKGFVVAAFFVAPMRGDTVFRQMVHLAGANLNFKGEGHAAAANHGGVQRLIHVVFRYGNIILEAAGHLRPQRVANAQHAVAFGDGIDDHADSDQIVNLVEGLVLDDHLAVDGIQVLGAADDLEFHAHFGQLLRKLLNYELDIILALGTLDADLARNVLIAFGIDIAQGEIFQLRLDFIHAQTMRQRGVNIQRFTGDGHLTVGRFEFKRAHIVQPVCQFNQYHADIAAHGQDHFAQRFSLMLFTIGEIQLVQLGYAVYQAGDFLAKHLCDRLERDALAILHRIVQKACGDGRRVNADFRQNAGNIHRVHKIGLAAQARLPAVLFFSKLICARNQIGIGIGVIMLEALEHLLKLHAYIDSAHQASPPWWISWYKGSSSGDFFCIGKSCGEGVSAMSAMLESTCAMAFSRGMDRSIIPPARR